MSNSDSDDNIEYFQPRAPVQKPRQTRSGSVQSQDSNMSAVDRILQFDSSLQQRQLMGTFKREDTIESNGSNRSSARQDRRQSKQISTRNMNLTESTIPEESTKERNDDDFIAWLMGNRQTIKKTDNSTADANQEPKITEQTSALERKTSLTQVKKEENADDDTNAARKSPPTNAVDDRNSDKPLSRKSSSRKISTESDQDVVIGADTGTRNQNQLSSITAKTDPIQSVKSDKQYDDAENNVNQKKQQQSSSRKKSESDRPTNTDDDKSSVKSKAIYRRSLSNVSFTDSISLRKATYNDWLQNKERQLERKRKLLMKQQSEKKDQENEKQERRREAKKMWEKWKTEKDELNKQIKSKEKHREAEKQKKIQEEKQTKKKEAEVMFNAWKKERDLRLRSTSRQRKQKEEEAKVQKKQQTQEKKMDAEKMFQSWAKEKDAEVKRVADRLRKLSMNKEQESNQAKRNKEELSARAYEAWLNRKHKDMIDNIMFRQQPYDINEIPLPWVPSNPTVPSNYKPKIH